MFRLPLRQTCYLFSALSLVALPAAVLAEDITYDGANPALLKTVNSQPNVLAPTITTARQTDSPSGNNVTVTGGTMTAVYGALNLNDGTILTNNHVIITGGFVADNANSTGIIGANSYSGEVTGNSVTIGTGANIGSSNSQGKISGGNSVGNVIGNTVTITGGTIRYMDIYGGSNRTSASDVTNNKVILSGGSFIGVSTIDGGYGINGAVSGNSVSVDGVIISSVNGGQGSGGSVTGNSVTITSGTVSDTASGGYSDTGPVSNNQVIVNSGSVSAVNGGYSGSGIVSNNQVIVAGGFVGSITSGGQSVGGIVMGNGVTINGGTVSDVFGGNTNSGRAANNWIIINNSITTLEVIGGISTSGDATGNSVTINGGTLGDHVLGGSSQTGNATSNRVSVTGGSLQDVYGGSSGSGNATGNTVTISGTPTLNGILYGGYSSGSGDARTGNTLNIKSSGLSAMGIQNFANYNFYLPTDMVAGQTMLTLTQGDGNGHAADISNSTIGVGINGGTSALHAGDQVVLIHSGTGLTATGINTRAMGLQGIARLYDFDLSTDADNLYATVVALPPGPSDGGSSGDGGSADGEPSGGAGRPAYRLNPQLKALSEGRAGGLAFVGQGADLLIGPGMNAALAATGPQGHGIAPFAAVSGGASRYATGSHVDVNGFSMLAGLAWRAPIAPKDGAFLAGAFFEAGSGNYNSFNAFTAVPNVRGDGDTSYTGGGIMARYEAAIGQGGLYGEASLRAGHTDVKFASSDILNPFGETRYTSGSAYYGAHAGIGYIWRITKELSLDLSTRYIWTHQDGDRVTIAGDSIAFRAADSRRWRSGARVAYGLNDMVSLYAGAYYDHEFDGRARATANGEAFGTPRLTGGTGVAELGVTVKPAGIASPLSVDLGVQGYTGKRQGASGTLRVKYEF